MMIKYARILIDIPLDGEFPDYIEFFNKEEVLITQQVQDEWKPIKCTYYKMFGHEEINCKKKGGTRTEWRPIQKTMPIGSNTEQLSQTAEQHPLPSMEEFTQVGMIGLTETKIKTTNDSFVATRAFPRWRWDNNSTPTIKGGIWIAWQPRSYEVYVTQVTTNKKFYITFVYGMIHEQQR
ncbi:hypothetical protein Cgig2_032286 [Carnegiea gigantea]|uniref:Uncharacterized protein n=1 Tax=Carnegiea gigantea TaxID=171969 RepID=A0A9Q1JIU5_9CARY|nr:hypothetical protein Cgig2_032286 [Carnegiea gigantea]